jgi:hypothetical protein
VCNAIMGLGSLVSYDLTDSCCASIRSITIGVQPLGRDSLPR